MKRVYISSTVEDLREHRQAVSEFLHNCGYDVDAMEKYPARDDRPQAASEADTSNCDFYIGIFAWRYRFVPVMIILKASPSQNANISQPDRQRGRGSSSCSLITLLGRVYVGMPSKNGMRGGGFANFGTR